MLTGELIRVRVKKQAIHPSFIKLEERRLERGRQRQEAAAEKQTKQKAKGEEQKEVEEVRRGGGE